MILKESRNVKIDHLIRLTRSNDCKFKVVNYLIVNLKHSIVNLKHSIVNVKLSIVNLKHLIVNLKHPIVNFKHSIVILIWSDWPEVTIVQSCWNHTRR